jgi:hypothetical protein
MSLVVNMFSGPGTGKSSMTAGLFSELKWRGINCEMALEYAKDKVWEDSTSVLHNQVYILGKQYHRIFRLMEKVDVVLTDSPILLSLVYGKDMLPEFEAFVLALFRSMNTFNVFLQREKPYVEAGRLQTEEQARELDMRIRRMLELYNINFVDFPANNLQTFKIANIIEKEMKNGHM